VGSAQLAGGRIEAEEITLLAAEEILTTPHEPSRHRVRGCRETVELAPFDSPLGAHGEGSPVAALTIELPTSLTFGKLSQEGLGELEGLESMDVLFFGAEQQQRGVGADV